MPTIAIQATDTLFFRDGRPFSMGDDTFAETMFPPPPSVIYGALRSSNLANSLNSGSSLSQQLIENTGNLAIQGIALKHNGEVLFPMPADLVVDKKKTKGKHLISSQLVTTNAPEYSSYAFKKMLRSDVDKVKEGVHLIADYALGEYLNGIKPNSIAISLSDITTSEAKIGIGRNDASRTTDDGLMYRVNMIRPATFKKNKMLPTEILVAHAGLDLSKSTWLALGGERRSATLTAVSDFPNFEAPKQNGTGVFKLYLSTMAVFCDGWQPKKLFDALGLTVIAAAINRSQPIGGWDIKRKQPKPMLHTVAAGSVYYLQPSRDNWLEIVEKMHGKAISDIVQADSDYAKQGFGIAYLSAYTA